MSEQRWSTDGLNENTIDAIALEHGLYVGPRGKELIGEELTDEQAPRVEMDIAFARLNPALPIENVCSRLDNYNPFTPSQETFLANAKKLAAYRNPSRLAGFVACGAAGLGKTHVAVGVAKEALMTGQKPLYINAPGSPMVTGLVEKATKSDIVIIDDLNTPHNRGVDAAGVRQVLAAMHDQGGGKLMITSNAPNNEAFLNILLPTDPVERTRIQDRISSALLRVVVTGESFRTKNAAGQLSWWEE